MSEALIHLIDVIARYLHIVSATVLVGGTLFYEMVVPEAVEELKHHQQLDVVGRARWVFKRLVWGAAIFIIISGVISTRKHWQSYSRAESIRPAAVADEGINLNRRPGWWWAAHASTGVLAVVIALFLVNTRQPPSHPIGWMRLNLVILLIVIFLATVTREVRSLADTERIVRIPAMFPD
jgi:peptidoglycan/LPS O-acetylase OafA/YrhL